MKRHSTKIAYIDPPTRSQIVSLRSAGKDVNTICARLDLHKPSERNAVSQICAEPGLRAYGRGIEIGGPVRRGRNSAAAIRP